MARRQLDNRNSDVSSSRTTDSLLSAARDGWATTLRYAMLLLVKRGTVGMILWMVAEIVVREIAH